MHLRAIVEHIVLSELLPHTKITRRVAYVYMGFQNMLCLGVNA